MSDSPPTLRAADGSLRLAKLTPPQVGHLVPRDRLFGRLDALRRHPLVWLAAPPGAGKTSLVASWLQARHRPTLWLQLDGADADPASFFHHLGLALPGLCGNTAALPPFTPDEADRVAMFARRWFRQAFAALPADAALVFDNLQDADGDGSLSTLVAVLVHELPSGVQVLAISRHPPPAALARAQASQLLTLLGAAELQCRDDEALAIALLGGGVAEPLLAQVLAQAQGWAAGIVLLMESVRRGGVLPDQSAAALASGRETVFDYFASEVLAGSEPQWRQALLRLSFLPRIAASAAAAIAGHPQAVALLESLARRHLFTERRFEPEPTFQFHALFRDFLQAQAQHQLSAAEQADCLQQAARLLQAAGHESDAFALYARAGLWADAAALVLAQAPALVAAGRHRTLGQWIERLPAALQDADPWLVYWLGVARTGIDPPASRAALEGALARFARSDDRLGQVRALTALLSGWWNEPDSVAWLDPCMQRLARLLDDGLPLDAHTVASALVALAFARLMIRPTDPALHGWVHRLAALARDGLPPAVALAAGTCLLQYHWGVGDSDACDRVVLHTRALALRPDLPPGERVWFWFWLMTHQVYRADAESAREAMAQAREVADEARRAPPFLDFVRWDVTLLLQQGCIAEARQLHTQQLEPQRSTASRFTQACIDLEWVRCANEEGRFDEAIARGRQAMQVCSSAGHDWLQVVLGLSVCCAQALSGRLAEGFETLAELRRLSGDALPLQGASVHAVEALLHLRAGDRRAAAAALDRAMALRGNTAYLWGPGWNRPAIAALAAFALEEQSHVAVMRSLIAGLRLTPPGADALHWPWPVRLRVLDGFRLDFEAPAVPATAPRKPPHRLLDLLKVLAGLGGQQVPVQMLCDLVWPDAEGDAALRSLETSLSRLRRLLGSERAVSSRGGKVSLDPEWVCLDLAAFDKRWQTCNTMPDTSPDWPALAESALALYRRPLLDSEPELPWLLTERRRWHQRWRDLATRLAEQHRSRGNLAAAQRLELILRDGSLDLR
jgi:LuxR family transcriptional regulator, maltose regulon positive regulatory protein